MSLALTHQCIRVSLSKFQFHLCRFHDWISSTVVANRIIDPVVHKVGEIGCAVSMAMTGAPIFKFIVAQRADSIKQVRSFMIKNVGRYWWCTQFEGRWAEIVSAEQSCSYLCPQFRCHCCSNSSLIAESKFKPKYGQPSTKTFHL